jgi:hypothetical protein
MKEISSDFYVNKNRDHCPDYMKPRILNFRLYEIIIKGELKKCVEEEI